jgi:hypothetical protein
LNCSVVETVSGQGTSLRYGARQLEVDTGTSLTVRPSTCTPVEATPPPASLNVVVMLCTPLTGPPAPNIALDGPEAIVGALTSLSARSTRDTRTAAASDALSPWHGATHWT